jgi:8-oxo-dGTP pyrophosphatase MutT (NUDIX family)
VFRLDAVVEKLARLGSAGDVPDVADDYPRAAVAAILREGPAGAGAEGAEVFFIVRAESPTDPWSGHIAFPGGRREPTDESLLATAIRETSEEVGIDLDRSELVARLPDVPAFIRSKRGRLVVTPFVFATRKRVTPTLNYEVAGTLWVPLAKLARGEGKGTYAFTWDEKPYELPCFRLEPGQRVLWGMTHRMVETMLESLGKSPSP